MTEKVTKGIPKNNYCELCDYSTSHLGSFTKHLLTKRHKNREFGDAGDKKLTKTHQHVCSQCDKLFNSRNGLWKHKKICDIVKTDTIIEKDNMIQTLIKENNNFKHLIIDVVKSNSDLQQHCTNLQQQFIEVYKHSTTTNLINNTNSHNKTFNLQFFLNEQCKDAMNLSDFVKSVTLQLSDLEHVGQMGMWKAFRIL